ncbi:MAG: hypothetical protein DHS20C18_12900 [Saprospiraceae bacterium]|nr:MAG: hypothetical protein DHS20C18_12900 [Saprospiraceae bacterium]
MVSNKYQIFILFLSFFCLSFSGCQKAVEPEPFGAVPSRQQQAWQALEYYAFVHFNINTFSNLEWGKGSESPEIFNPTALDCRQWARICKDAGMKGIILTAKHHDGFCLWDSEYSEHDVASSPWRNGKGDVLRELADACKEYGLKMGLYLSPWDQNSTIYGKPEYNEYFKKQLTEVLTNYGDIFEVWFDGAVGEAFKGQQIYDWDGFIATVREHQPNAVIFSDAGPDIRWVGNEQGFANPTNWSTLNREDYFPGTPRYQELQSGNQRGSHWLPAEVDVSIRPGWYYHANQDQQVKSADQLELIYYHSVGRNANLLLNLPVDRRGLVHPNDSAALMQLKERLDGTFSENLATGAKVRVTDEIVGQKKYAPGNLTDNDPETAWAAPEDMTTVGVELDLDGAQTFNVIDLREFIALGQRVESFEVKAWIDNNWQLIGKGTTIGNRRLLPLPTVTTHKIRVRIKQSMAPPILSEIGLYLRPHQNFLLESKSELETRMQWWRDAAFGMFIHWGAYAVPAGIYQGKEISGIGEWIMNNAKIPIPEYEQFVRRFNPQSFNAEEWVAIAKQAGMKYIVITSKHHDGFCLWDSEVSQYDIMDASPYKRDLLLELSEACKKENIKLCFYHSIMDWHHPQASGASFATYRDQYLKPQLKELIERYDPHVLWFDGEWIEEWTEPQGKDLYQYIRSLKPEIIINNRVGKGRKGMQGMNANGEFVGDFGTPEQEILEHGSADFDWESCMTMNDTWGFKKNDHNWKSAEMLLHNLIDIVSKGGNYLLNVGPDASGLIPEHSQKRLKEMGDWMAVNGAAIYNTRMWPQYKEGEHIRYLQGNDGFVYVALLNWPGSTVNLRYIHPKTGSAISMLGHDTPLDWTFDATTGTSIQISETLQDPDNRPGKYAWVLKIQGSFPQGG